MSGPDLAKRGTSDGAMFPAKLMGTSEPPLEMTQRCFFTGSWEIMPINAPGNDLDLSSASPSILSLRLSLNFLRSGPLP